MASETELRAVRTAARLQKRVEQLEPLEAKLAEISKELTDVYGCLDFLCRRSARVELKEHGHHAGLIRIAWFDDKMRPQAGHFATLRDGVKYAQSRESGPLANPGKRAKIRRTPLKKRKGT